MQSSAYTQLIVIIGDRFSKKHVSACSALFRYLKCKKNSLILRKKLQQSR